MKQLYKINNSIEKLLNGKAPLFLDNNEFKQIKSKLKNNNYNIYIPYKDSEKIILYSDNIPKISLFEIRCLNQLRHQDILGSLMSLNIKNNYLGDIIIDDNKYYFYIISDLDNFIESNLKQIGNNNITLKKIDLDVLKNYTRKYEEKTIVVSSLRIDNVISKIIKTNRDNVLQKIKDKEIILNYEILLKNTYILKENDVFSIRKYGKYKYIGSLKNTKKDNYIIKYLKYI